MTPIIPDPELDRFLTILGQWDGAEFAWEQFEGYKKQAAAAAAIAEPPETPLTHDLAVPALRRARDAILEDLMRQVGAWDSLRWLWYLRKFPLCAFSRRKPHGWVGTSYIAETIAALGASSLGQTWKPGEIIRYHIDSAILRSVVRLYVGADLLHELIIRIKQVGRGAPFVVDKDGLPCRTHNDGWDLAFERFEEEVQANDSLLIFTGIYDPRKEVEISGPSVVLVAGWRSPPDWCDLPAATVQPGATGQVQLWCPFGAKLVSMEVVRRLNADPRVVNHKWWSDKAIPLACILSIAATIRRRVFLQTMVRDGILLTSAQDFLGYADRLWSGVCAQLRLIFPNCILPANCEELLCQLLAMRPTVLPLVAGCPARRIGDLVLIDLIVCSRLLADALVFRAEGGELANARGAYFETLTQEVIDDSPWRPNGGRELIGRTLCDAHGKQITDIDAVAERSSDLILISCKSKSWSAEYEYGDFRRNRALASSLLDDIRAWSQKIEYLRSYRTGRNYDLTGFKSISGVLVTPCPVFLSPEQTSQMTRDVCDWTIVQSLQRLLSERS